VIEAVCRPSARIVAGDTSTEERLASTEVDAALTSSNPIRIACVIGWVCTEIASALPYAS
jgi:hypothetical protein